MKRMFRYVCVRTSCGYVELTTFAPSATGRCAKCGGGTRRENA